MLLRFYLLLISAFFIAHVAIGQEICNDAIDNDGDGLIDLNDFDDCQCQNLTPSSLIPNPSFEDMSCCPNFEGQLNCAVSWRQASVPTTDYVHTCGVLGNTFIGSVAPLPFPDGNGGVGFRDGKPSNPQFKEYVGSCLNETMVVGLEYRLDFFVGFHRDPSSRFLPLAIFGATNCNNLPFGGNNDRFGCPTNSSDWFLIGKIDVSGNNEWVNVVFDFTADFAYDAIVLGPGCEPHPNFNDDPYFFIDRLALAEKSNFSIPFADITGEACDDNLLLIAEANQLSYQWYLDGIALLGETSVELTITTQNTEGTYQVLIENTSGCFLSEPFDFVLPIEETFNTVEICEGDAYKLGTQTLTIAGNFSETFQIGSFCDSISNIELIILEDTESFVSETICQGDSIIISNNTFRIGGQFQTVTQNVNGCDSIINVDISVLFPVQNLVIDSIVNINLGESSILSPTTVSPDAISFEWYNESEFISSEPSIEIFPIDNDTYTLIALTIDGCRTERRINIIVDATANVYIPNVISQDSPSNNRFIIGTNAAVMDISAIRIFDRWGNLDHEYSGSIDNYEGWNGTRSDKELETGIYTYIINLELVNNSNITRTGNITLLK